MGFFEWLFGSDSSSESGKNDEPKETGRCTHSELGRMLCNKPLYDGDKDCGCHDSGRPESDYSGYSGD